MPINHEFCVLPSLWLVFSSSKHEKGTNSPFIQCDPFILSEVKKTLAPVLASEKPVEKPPMIDKKKLNCTQEGGPHESFQIFLKKFILAISTWSSILDCNLILSKIIYMSLSRTSSLQYGK